ncbi:FAD-dependent oxidoreductase, partial [Cycloclasticus pugetii]|uniref:FAD-dependent oxidoreductase n=1 Tax=Cycloclasticus pugetii TaxID=34068 RepID=UPI003A958AE5
TKVDASTLNAMSIDHVLLATGIRPRVPELEGVGHEKVLSYLDVLKDRVNVGKTVAIIGAGGIGFDTAEFLLNEADETTTVEQFAQQWGIDQTLQARGGLATESSQPMMESARKIYLLQRKRSKPGAGLGKTTGWIHRAQLKQHGVEMWSGCQYQRIDDSGLWIERDEQSLCLAVDHVILCAGQEPDRTLVDGLELPYTLIGGADVSKELDAKRAIAQGTKVALQI